ncbi:hypothetical protein H0H92_002407 [Tricholoma furcatifolium]|nr:hypothetical protein H0H92_002407 [Tricholoma furcatifolium]
MKSKRSKRKVVTCPRKPVPVEIEELIFEWAAWMHRRYAPTLSIFSKYVQERVERIIYETLVIDVSGFPSPAVAHASNIFSTLSSRPEKFFAMIVKNLFITDDVPLHVKEVAISKCTGVLHLVYLDDPLTGGGRLISTSSVLSSLYISQNLIPEVLVPARGIEFPNLLLLGIFDMGPPEPVPSLHWLPALKTVHVDIDRSPALPRMEDQWKHDLSTILPTTPHLRVLWIDILLPDSATYVQQFINGLNINNDVEIGIRYAHHHWGMFNFMFRWWEIIWGHASDCKPSKNLLDSNYGDEKAVRWRCLDEDYQNGDY